MQQIFSMLGKWPKSVSCFSKRTLKMGKKFYGILREIDDVTNTTISIAVPNAIEKLISIFFFSFLMYPKPPQRARFLPILLGCNVL